MSSFFLHKLHIFSIKDVCEVLEIIRHRDAVDGLDEDERGRLKVDTLGGIQEMRENLDLTNGDYYTMVWMLRQIPRPGLTSRFTSGYTAAFLLAVFLYLSMVRPFIGRLCGEPLGSPVPGDRYVNPHSRPFFMRV